MDMNSTLCKAKSLITTRTQGSHQINIQCYCPAPSVISTCLQNIYQNQVLQPISHITTCCGGVFQLHNLARAAREDASLDNGSKAARQQKLRKAICQANPQDLALYRWMKLVCLHNTSIYKINDSNFCDVHSCKKTPHKTFTNTMLELSLIVEEKKSVEMKGKREIIMHDKWNKYSRHYVCLLPIYLLDTGKIEVLGQEVMQTFKFDFVDSYLATT
jgi:hypothetical protein